MRTHTHAYTHTHKESGTRQTTGEAHTLVSQENTKEILLTHSAIGSTDKQTHLQLVCVCVRVCKQRCVHISRILLLFCLPRHLEHSNLLKIFSAFASDINTMLYFYTAFRNRSMRYILFYSQLDQCVPGSTLKPLVGSFSASTFKTDNWRMCSYQKGCVFRTNALNRSPSFMVFSLLLSI